MGIAEVAQRGATQRDGPGQHRTHCAQKPLEPRPAEPVAARARVDAGHEQRLAGVDVAGTDQQFARQQGGLDRRAAVRACGMQTLGGERRIPGLGAQALQQASLPDETWHAIGQCVGSLHARGVQHADLNAHNLLVGASNDIYVLDFDRGRIRARGTWERAVLARLQRSLRKVTTALPAERFSEAHWQALLAGAGAG